VYASSREGNTEINKAINDRERLVVEREVDRRRRCGGVVDDGTLGWVPTVTKRKRVLFT